LQQEQKKAQEHEEEKDAMKRYGKAVARHVRLQAERDLMILQSKQETSITKQCKAVINSGDKPSFVLI
jgi:hypothetical protein